MWNVMGVKAPYNEGPLPPPDSLSSLCTHGGGHDVCFGPDEHFDHFGAPRAVQRREALRGRGRGGGSGAAENGRES